MSLDFENFDSITTSFKKLLNNIDASENEVLMSGAKVQYGAIKNTLPVASGKEKRTVTITKPRRENNETIVEIGWTEDSKVSYRTHIVEWGTVHQPPQLTITKAIKSSERAKQQAMIKELKRRL